MIRTRLLDVSVVATQNSHKSDFHFERSTANEPPPRADVLVFEAPAQNDRRAGIPNLTCFARM
jgi:hypothetical protein